MCNKRTVESLVKAGAFDSLGHTRRGLVAVHAEAIDAVLETKRAEAIGQFDLFGGGEDGAPALGFELAIPVGEWEKSVLLAAERDMLGLYVSDHPLMGVEHVLAQVSDVSVAGLMADEDRADGSIVTIAGLVSGLQRKMTKQGNPWAIATIEDLEGAIDVMFFPATYTLVATQLVEDAVVVVRGRLDKREEAPRLVAHGDDPARPHGGRAGSDRHQHAGGPVHPARGRPAQGCAREPPRRDPRAPPAPVGREDHGPAARRPAAGLGQPGAVR